MKLCLGTAQFGMDYGVCGGRKPTLPDVISMLDYATQNGVDAIDTAVAYGDAESVVGEFLRLRTLPREDLFVVSKFSSEIFGSDNQRDYDSALIAQVEESLKRLHLDYLDAYICHNPSAVCDERIACAMKRIVDLGLTRHVGFSIYESDEALSCLANTKLDFIQAPFSVFDQRMSRDGVLSRCAQKNVDVHCRSVFVQGLALMEPNEVPEYLKGFRPYISSFRELCSECGVSPRSMAMAFVKNHAEISHLVFGVDNMEQLRGNISSFNESVPTDVIDEAARLFFNIPSALVMPNKWRSGK